MSVDELESLGMGRMDEAAMRQFLASQTEGVLGLPDDPPYLLPMSYGYDGESRCYFVYVLGGASRKRDLTETASRASFLVYSVTSTFNWRSLLLTGTLSPVSDEEWESVRESVTPGWRPDLIERADLSGGVAVYALDIEEWVGLRHTGLPPGLRGDDGPADE